MWRVLIRRIKEEQEGKSLPNFDLVRYLTTRMCMHSAIKVILVGPGLSCSQRSLSMHDRLRLVYEREEGALWIDGRTHQKEPAHHSPLGDHGTGNHAPLLFGTRALLVLRLQETSLHLTDNEDHHRSSLQFACNNFTVSDGEMKPLGLGIYPPAALINHSCDPNCIIIFEGKLLSAHC
jgi:hypothetical protein